MNKPSAIAPLVRTALLAALFAAAFSLPAWGQSYAITNAHIHPVSGPDIERGTVLVVDGKIAQLGRRLRVPGGARRIDGRGKHVYPGLFNSDTNIGLTEIGAVAVSNDSSEMGAYSPQLLAWTAIHVESEHIPVARVDGITHVVTRPSGGTIAGQGAAVHLDGWTQEEMEIDRRAALYLNLPSLLSTRSSPFGGRFGSRNRTYKTAKKEFDEKVVELKELFARVRHYAESRSEDAVPNRRLEALMAAVKGEQPVVIPANSHADIKNAVEFAQGEGLNYLILGASDAWMITDFLKENDVRVILGPRQVLPNRNDDPIDIIYQTPRILQEKGVRFALATGGSANARTLPFEVGNAVAHGLSAHDALRSITLTPAEFFGIDDRLGSIEEGKIANLLVTDGDIFEYQSKIHHVFIQGKDIPLDSKHSKLYEKYIARP